MGAAYTLDRAAALAGVPRSTVHHWATTAVLVPSVSAERVRLWSYSDLMSLRMIDWLRRSKESPRGATVPRTSMKVIKRALLELADQELELWDEDHGASLSVDLSGRVFVQETSTIAKQVGARQLARTDLIELIAPFQIGGPERVGPDLRAPRPHLRILPGKLAGSPHIVDTRVETQSLAALAARRMPIERIASLYPSIDELAIREAIDLEAQLQRNLAA